MKVSHRKISLKNKFHQTTIKDLWKIFSEKTAVLKFISDYLKEDD